MDRLFGNGTAYSEYNQFPSAQWPVSVIFCPVLCFGIWNQYSRRRLVPCEKTHNVLLGSHSIASQLGDVYGFLYASCLITYWASHFMLFDRTQNTQWIVVFSRAQQRGTYVVPNCSMTSFKLITLSSMLSCCTIQLSLSIQCHNTIPSDRPFRFYSALVMAQYVNIEFWIVDISAVPFRSAAYFVYVTTIILSQNWTLNDALLSNWHYWILI